MLEVSKCKTLMPKSSEGHAYAILIVAGLFVVAGRPVGANVVPGARIFSANLWSQKPNVIGSCDLCYRAATLLGGRFGCHRGDSLLYCRTSGPNHASRREATAPGSSAPDRERLAHPRLGMNIHRHLSSHDLDIRGAGNLLGDEQSGHIREVGIELYQQMLKDAVADIRA
jgi:hypothetical protein